MNRIFIFCTLSLVLIMVSSCNPTRKWEKEEQMAIENYLNTLGDTVVVSKPSGLYYVELQTGLGRTPIENDTVSIRYKGTFLDGFVFGSNENDTIDYSFIVGKFQVIEGIDEGVRYMKEGGITRLLIPSKLGYGSSGYGAIPGYTPLLFTVNLTHVRPGSKR